MPIKVCPTCEGCIDIDKSPNDHPCVSCLRCWDYAVQDNYATTLWKSGKESLAMKTLAQMEREAATA